MRNLLFLILLSGCGVQRADLLLRDATIYDGSGGEGFKGHIAIRGDTIIGVGEWAGTARRTIDARGLVAAPGFIDLHSHSDLPIYEGGESPILVPRTRYNYNFTSQGCTTIVTGNCGKGALDTRKYFDGIDRNGAGTNVVHLLPHATIRQKVFGSANRAPSARELEEMKAVVRDGMNHGAWGMSTGLWYPPASYAGTEEIIELSKVVHEFGGIYASHIRSEDSELLEAIEEAIEIGAKSGCPAHISHLKCSTRDAWGKMDLVCGLIEAARAKGQKVTADQYPYTASSTRLGSYLVPSWAHEGGHQKLVERLDDPVQGAKIREIIAKNLELYGGADRFRIAAYKPEPRYNGKSVAEIAKEEGKDPVAVSVALIKGGEAGARAVAFAMQEEDLVLAMRKSYVATASDGKAAIPGTERPHPRFYGTFPRKIGRYAIEKKALPLAAAIRSASGLPADILGMSDRGYLKPGYKADLVLFDPRTFRDRATFDDPNQYSAGTEWVFVNGVAVIEQGRKTDALPGRPLRLGR